MTITLELTPEQEAGIAYRAKLDNWSGDSPEEGYVIRATYELDRWAKEAASEAVSEIAEKIKDLDQTAVDDIKDYIDTKVAEKDAK